MENQPIVQYHYRRSFLASAATGASLCVVTFTLCAAVIVVYGMRIFDTKTEGLAAMVANAVKGVPEFAKSLPPVFSDALRDQRRPDYKDKLQIKARLAAARDGAGALRPVIEIQNTGASVVSLLALRLTVLDQDGTPIGDWAPWAATPFAIENEWPGLLMPGSTRHISSRWAITRGMTPPEAVRIEVEITELRLWEPEQVPERNA